MHHLLRPLPKQFLWVVKSIKAVVTHFAALLSYCHNKLWLVTENITVFYTNVLIHKAAQIIDALWEESPLDKKSISRHNVRIFLNRVIDNNYFVYDVHLSHPAECLTMRTSYSSLVAKLHFAFFKLVKSTFGQVPNYRRYGDVKMYTRYIENVFFFFEGTGKVLMRRLNFLEFEGLYMGWSYSARRELILNLELLIFSGLQDTRVQIRVYHKPMNWFLYISL